MIKTAQYKVFKLAENFAQKLLSFGKAISLDDAIKCLLSPLEDETFTYSDEDPLIFIRYVYRTKSRKMHPDINPDDPDASAKQSALNTAYDVLKECEPNRLKNLLKTYSNEEKENLESHMGREKIRTPENPTASETTEDYNPKPRKGGLFGTLPKNYKNRF